MLFPFDWTTRIRGPVSYWDPRFHGRGFAIFEIMLDAVLVVFLAAGPAARWRARRLSAAAGPAH
ncbi:MAG: hypothetical protein H0U85_04970 [Gemmatimonadales bacterium]|nr:hypothetical protein [Gemmatimonadales bacterium]